MNDYKILITQVEMAPTNSSTYIAGVLDFVILPSNLDDRTTAPEVFCELLKGRPLLLMDEAVFEEQLDQEELNEIAGVDEGSMPIKWEK